MTGEVVTFYSYKGGVGRSFVLANAAALLARWGLRVLCVDWDLEAPGLSLYFQPHLPPGTHEGVVELMLSGAGGPPLDWRELRQPVSLPDAKGSVDLIPAGRVDGDDYGRTLRSLDWGRLYDDHGLGRHIENLREQWVGNYNLVFIDSRTGITDIGAICTAQLPDSLVFLFAPNRQGFEGALRSVDHAIEARARLPLNRSRLLTLPLPARLDLREEYTIGRRWMERFAEELAPFYAPWAHEDATPDKLLEHLRVPYQGIWSYGEELPVLTESDTDREAVSYWIATVAALLARRFGHSEELVANRDGYVESARAECAEANRRYMERVQEFDAGKESPRPRVYIASAHLYDEDRRKVVVDAVQRAGMTPVAVERFTASAQPSVSESLRLARGADLLVCIAGWRYGWIPPDEERSIVELEYYSASERMAFILDDSVPIRMDLDLDPGPDAAEKLGRQNQFRKRLAEEPAVYTFTDERLGTMLLAALTEWKRTSGTMVKRRPTVASTNGFDLYARQIAALHETVSLAGFETRVRVPIQLEDMYVPLDAVVDTGAYDEAGFGSAEEAEQKLHEHARDTQLPLTEAFQRADELGGRRGLVILGDPGSGKTTHLKRLLLWLVREGPASIGLPEGMLPVFLPLRNLRDLDAGLDAFIESELDAPYLGLPDGFGRRLLKRGNLLLLLDGLDEVGSDDRGKVARWIENAMEKHRSSRFVVTCRYAGYVGGAKLDARLLELHLRPLTAEQASAFVHNWYRIVEISLASDRERARVVAEGNADALVDRLSQSDFRARRVFELTRNPLLLTAICLVHRDRGRLPQRRAELYEECTNVLLERWRESKRLPVSIDAKSALRILQPVALWLHGIEGRTRASADELAPVIEPRLSRVRGALPNADAFLRSIRDESGLLTGWSGDQYGFMHLGFQEYLAARELKDQAFDEPEVLEALAENFGESWWREVSLLLLALEGPPIFERFMRLVVEQPGFAEHADLVEECLDDALEIGMAPFLDLLRRKPGKSEGLWQRQLQALRVLERRAPEDVAGLASKLRRHPYPAIAGSFAKPSRRLEVVRADPGGYELLRIPGGKFLMGSPEDEEGRDPDEGPQHEVELDDFYLGRAPVTNEEYGRFLQANPDAREPAEWGNRKYNQPKQPVVGVSWNDATAYCDWAGLVLPTEAQWEYACRAGTTTRYWSGDSEEDLARVGWYAGNSGDQLHPVAEKPANPLGLYDVHGNIWEWCRDGWGQYGRDPVEGPEGERQVSGSGYRVSRGGGFVSGARIARSAYRLNDHPSYRWHYRGFRPARGTTG